MLSLTISFLVVGALGAVKAQTPIDNGHQTPPQQPLTQTVLDNDIESDLRHWFSKELFRLIFHRGIAKNPPAPIQQLNKGFEHKQGDNNKPLFGQGVDNGPSFVKKANLYGINRPLGVRRTRLADFGSMILPNKNSGTGRSAVIRYG